MKSTNPRDKSVTYELQQQHRFSKMSRLIFFTICATLCFTYTESQSVSVVDLSTLLCSPPYYSALGYDRPVYLSDASYQKLLEISEQYNIKLSDLYQMYDLSKINLPSCDSDTYITMIEQFAEAIQIERMRRGLPCNRYLQRSSSLFIDSVINTPVVLQRRNVMDTLDNFYEQGSEAASSIYNNLYNMANYAISKTTQAFQNQINDIIYGNTPQADMSHADNFAHQMNESLKYMMS